jgi:adenylate cyclase
LGVRSKTALRFRGLAKGEIANQKKLAFLKRYFDPKIFRVIEENPDLLNIRKKTVTIVFCDIRGFSRLCEILKEYPSLISSFLREYFGETSEIIFKHGGVLDKFIGDAVMAIFGAFDGEDDQGRNDSISAVTAAVEINAKFNSILGKWLEEWQLYTPQNIETGLGIGVHTGEVLIGNVGTEIRDQFTALGPHVNFAQRIETRTGIGQILISATTKSRVHQNFRLNKVGSINDVKNIPGTFDVFEIIQS